MTLLKYWQQQYCNEVQHILVGLKKQSTQNHTYIISRASRAIFTSEPSDLFSDLFTYTFLVHFPSDLTADFFLAIPTYTFLVRFPKISFAQTVRTQFYASFTYVLVQPASDYFLNLQHYLFGICLASAQSVDLLRAPLRGRPPYSRPRPLHRALGDVDEYY